LIVE
jgi:hypothetical protein